MTTTWETVAQTAMDVVTALTPFVTAFAPGASEGLAIGVKIAQGVLAEVPAAISLFEQIKSGTPPTPEQIKAFENDYEAAYQTLRAEIAAKLAALP